MHYFFFKVIKVNNVATSTPDNAATIIYAWNGIVLYPIVAIIGYNAIPFQAYIIVAALSALLIATLLTLITLKKN